MRKTFKYILNFILIFTAIFIFSVIIINTVYKEEVKQGLIAQIKTHTNTNINTSNIELSIWERFPYTSISFHNLLINESPGFNNDSLIYAKKAVISFSILDFIKSEYNINSIQLSEGVVNIKYNENNENNFSIFKNNTGENKIIVEKIMLTNCAFSYQKITPQINIDWDMLQAVIELNNEYTVLNSNFFSKKLEVNQAEYLENKKCVISANFNTLQDSIKIHKSTVLIENVKTNVSGHITNGNNLNLNITASEQKINSIISEMPNQFKPLVFSFLMDGMLDVDAKIKGIISKEINPSFNMNFNVSEGSFKLKTRPFILENINALGNINNGSKNNFQSTVITFDDFKSTTKNGYLKGVFTVTNLNKYFLDASLNSSWDLSEVNYYFQDSPFIKLNGKLTASTDYKGFISFDDKFTDYFIAASHNSNVTLGNVSFKYLDSPLNFNIKSAGCIFDNNVIKINESQLEISKSDLSFSGELKDFIPYIFERKKKMNIKGYLSSKYMLFDELITIKDIQQEESSLTTLPTWVSLDLKTNVLNFTYKNFNSENLRGILIYDDLKLEGSNFISDALEGVVNGSFILKEPTKNYLTLHSDFELKKINIKEFFKSFNNFNQTFITQKDLNGIGTAEVALDAHWKPGLIFYDEKLKIKSHLIIEQGELIEFEPLKKLSVFVDLDDLKNVKFSTLENTIEVENKIISIPAMEINSSALSLFLSGTHTFDKEIDYSIKLLLSEILSNNFKNKESEFGEINKDGQIFTTAYLKMTGNTDDINISFDGLKIKENIKENINTEIKKVNTIIKEDILKTQDKEEEGEDIIIEWEKEYMPE